jgi:hypothetical protein
LLETIYFGEAVESLACRDPPLAGVILEDATNTTPTRIGDRLGQAGPYGCESSAVKVTDEPHAAVHIKLTRSILEDRANGLSKAIVFAVSDEAMPSNLQYSASLRAEPEIAVTILSQRAQVVAKTLGYDIGAKGFPVELSQTATECSNPHPSVRGLVYSHHFVVMQPICGSVTTSAGREGSRDSASIH